jgi:N-methylhydantoinase A
LHFQRSADVRYGGQGYELNVPLTSALVGEFHRQHEFRFGYHYPDREVELVTLRLRASMKSPRVPSAAISKRADVVQVQSRKVWFEGKAVLAKIHEREQLATGRRLRGAAVIAEYSATTFVPARNSFYIDRAGNLIVEVAKQERRPGSSAFRSLERN